MAHTESKVKIVKYLSHLHLFHLFIAIELNEFKKDHPEGNNHETTADHNAAITEILLMHNTLPYILCTCTLVAITFALLFIFTNPQIKMCAW